MHKINTGYMLAIFVTMTMTNFIGGFACGGYNMAGNILEQKMGWEKVDSVVITASGIFGLMIGSLFCEKILYVGRLKAALLANGLVIIATIPQMVLTVWSLSLGRFLMGTAGGMFNVICSVYMTETIPASEVSKYGVSTNLGIVIGLLVSALI